MKKSVWFALFAMVLIAMVDLIIYQWWLPDRLETQLKNGMTGGNLEFQDVQLSWSSGRLIGGEWNSPKWDLFLGEGLFSYSSFDWLFGKKSRTNNLELHDFRAVGKDEMDFNSSSLDFLKTLSYESVDFGCDTIEISGSLEWAELTVPFSLFARYLIGEKEVNGAIEIRLEESFHPIIQFFPQEKTLFLKFELKSDSKSGNEVFRASIVNENLGELKYARHGSFESIGFKLNSKSANGAQLNFSVNRKDESEHFTGDWNGTLFSQNLIGQFPVLSLIKGELESSGEISFDSSVEEMEISGDANFSASSLFFPKEGIINGQIKGSSQLKDKNWLFENFKILMKNQNNEKLEAQWSSPFSNPGKIEQILFQLNALEISRLEKLFPKDTKLSGNLTGQVGNDSFTLSADHLLLQHSGEDLEPIKATFNIPIISRLKVNRALDFEIETLPKFEIGSGFLPEKSMFFQQFKFRDFYLNGQVNSSGWSVNGGEFILCDNNREEIFSFSIKDKFLFYFNENGAYWMTGNRKEKGVISVRAKGFIPRLSLGYQDFSFTGEKKDLFGQIIFENGKPVWTFEDVRIFGSLKNKIAPVIADFIIRGDWRFYPSRGEAGLFTVEDIEMEVAGEKLLKGELSVFPNAEGEVSRIVSTDLKVNSSLPFFQLFSFPSIGDFENLKLSVHRLDWQFDQKTELILDGYIIGPGQSDSSNREFEIPVKWTFAKKNDQISHWLQLAYKRNSRSDLEISFQPEKNLLSFEGEKVNLTDLKNLIGTGSLSFLKDTILASKWMDSERKINAKLYFKTIILSPNIELTDCKADLNLLENKVFFKADFQDSPIEGSLNINFPELNSSSHLGFDLQLFGQDTNASVINSFIPQDIGLSGMIDWKLEAGGLVGGEYQFKIQLDVKEFAVDLLSQAGSSPIEWLKERMEESLGTSFSWSAPQTKMIEALSLLLGNLFFESGSVEIERTESGNWKFSQTDWRGPGMILLSRGTLSPEGNLKVNLFPGVKNKWADFLEVVNVLAAGKRRQGYRTLKREPLVIEGDGNRLSLSNWWRMLGQGIGLEPNE